MESIFSTVPNTVMAEASRHLIHSTVETGNNCDGNMSEPMYGFTVIFFVMLLVAAKLCNILLHSLLSILVE